jgi:alcohol dehydrogenase
MTSLGASIGIPSNLSELGVKEADLKVMSENAKKDACQFTNPRKANLDQVIGIFKAAM